MTVSKTQFTAGDLNVYSSPRDVSDVTRALRATGRRVMLVPTMGALHEGHLTLVRAAKRVQGAVVVVSIFVNPLQFGAGEDLHAYPRTLDEDLEVLRAEGVEIAFTPTAADMYPDGERTSVHPGPLGAELEGVGLGLLRTAPAVGALGVMLIATRRPPSRHAGRTLLICVAGFGVSMIVFGLSTTFALSMVALFFSGVTDGLSMIIRSTILRVLSPERIRGRVASVNWVFIGASNELGAFESGVAASIFGTVPTVVGGGLITLAVVGAVALMVPTLRTLDLDVAEPTDDVPSAAVPA